VEVLWTSILFTIAIGQATVGQCVARTALIPRAGMLGPFGSTIEVAIVPVTNELAGFLKDFGGAARI
jgi:hypothetical protein